MNIPGVGEVIYNKMRQRILEGAYASGERLNADELSRVLETSKTPIREALGHLASEGLVTFKPRVGWSVSSLSVGEFGEYLEFQYALRVFLSDNISPYIDKLDFELLGSINENMRRVLESRDYIQIIRQNDLFHMAILSAHPNKAILRRLEELDALIRLQRVRFFEQEKIHSLTVTHNSIEQHRLILEQFKTRDADAISRVSKEHFAFILEAYRRITQNGFD